MNNYKTKVNKQVNYGWKPLWWASYQITPALCLLKKVFCRVSGKIVKYTTLIQLIEFLTTNWKLIFNFYCSSRIDSNENIILFVLQKPSVAEVWIEYKSLPKACPQCFPSFLPLVMPLVTLHHSSVIAEMGKREMTSALASDLKKYHHRK